MLQVATEANFGIRTMAKTASTPISPRCWHKNEPKQVDKREHQVEHVVKKMGGARLFEEHTQLSGLTNARAPALGSLSSWSCSSPAAPRGPGRTPHPPQHLYGLRIRCQGASESAHAMPRRLEPCSCACSSSPLKSAQAVSQQPCGVNMTRYGQSGVIHTVLIIAF